jgi:D-sedoheptulose 7-phosphate isomerase
MTGPAPNPLAGSCDEALAVDAPSTAVVQAVHLVLVHALCAAVDAHLASGTRAPLPAQAAAHRLGHELRRNDLEELTG